MVAADPRTPAGLLERGLLELELDPDPGVIGALSELAMLLDTWAARINLTGHRGPEAIVRRLILDAVALYRVLPEYESLVDLGSGAGFPGLPIAILEPDRPVVLVEARRRRHHFQRAAARQLGLGNVEARLGRLDEIEETPASLVVAQALGPRTTVAAWMLRWAAPGAWLAVPGGPESPSPSLPRDALAEERICAYRVPLDGPARSLWLGRRTGSITS